VKGITYKMVLCRDDDDDDDDDDENDLGFECIFVLYKISRGGASCLYTLGAGKIYSRISG
jgi:hypothetical protein